MSYVVCACSLLFASTSQAASGAIRSDVTLHHAKQKKQSFTSIDTDPELVAIDQMEGYYLVPQIIDDTDANGGSYEQYMIVRDAKLPGPGLQAISDDGSDNEFSQRGYVSKEAKQLQLASSAALDEDSHPFHNSRITQRTKVLDESSLVQMAESAGNNTSLSQHGVTSADAKLEQYIMGIGKNSTMSQKGSILANLDSEGFQSILSDGQDTDAYQDLDIKDSINGIIVQQVSEPLRIIPFSCKRILTCAYYSTSLLELGIWVYGD